MNTNDIIEEIIPAAEDFCMHRCPYYPRCIYPACERVEYDGNRVVYRLDPYGVYKNESIQ